MRLRLDEWTESCCACQGGVKGVAGWCEYTCFLRCSEQIEKFS